MYVIVKNCWLQKQLFVCPMQQFLYLVNKFRYVFIKSSPVSGLDRPREFQEVKVPRFHDNGAGWW